MTNFKRFFKNMEALEEVVSYAYSEGSKANKELANKIAEKLTEYKDYKEIGSELGICVSVFYCYTDSNYRKRRSDHQKDKWENDPEFRKNRIERMKEYNKDKYLNNIADYNKKRNETSIMDIWTAEEVKNSIELNEEEIKKRGIVGNIEKRMEPFIEIGIIKVCKRNGKRFYKSNPENPYTIVMDGLWKD